MKMNKILAVLSILVIPFAISAHDMWVSFDGRLAKGKKVTMKFPSDHKFPASKGKFVSHKYLAKTYIIEPDGSRMQVARKSGNKYQSAQKLDKNGTYMVVSGKKWMYWVKTKKGYKSGINKPQVKNPLKCTYSGKFTKSFVNTGAGSGKAWSTRIGHDLEIIPQNDPAMLKKGDTLVVKVLLEGKPFEGIVSATYDTYSDKEDDFALSIKKSKNGVYRIPLRHVGRWLVKVGHWEPEEKDRKCDGVQYSSSLTFRVR